MEQIKRKEIYYADLTPVKGSEQGGIRPVLIIQNNMGNKYSNTVIVAAITSKQEKKETPMPTHVKIYGSGLEKDSIVLLEQIQTLDKTRLYERIGQLNRATMRRVNRAIAVSLDIPYMEEKKHGEESGAE